MPQSLTQNSCRGVTFRISTVNGGEAFQIDIADRSGLDRAILGGFLDAISTDTYDAGSFLAPALVVNRAEY